MMTKKELFNNLTLSVVKTDHKTIVTGRLQLHEGRLVETHEVNETSLLCIKEDIVESIWRRLYEDKRHDLYAAIDELISACQSWTPQLEKAKDNLLSVAQGL